MLVATFDNGKQLFLTRRWTKEQLLQIRKTKTLYCPTCRSPVILKLGTKKQWHFAHVKESALCKSFERESEYHLLGKKQLYIWLKKQAHLVYLEKYLRTISQRPDIFYERATKKVALEFQCSPIHFDLHYKRTTSYIKKDIYPFWIIGAKRLMRTGANFFTLHPFEWSSTFVIKSDTYPCLLYYCPYDQQFILLRNIISLTKTKIFATLQTEKLTTISSFHELFKNKPSLSIFNQWLQLKKHWRYSVSPYPNKAQKFFNDYCYHRKLSSFLFPSEAGWPLESSHFIETPLHIWQSWIIYEFIWNKPVNYRISFREVVYAFKRNISLGVFSIRILPLQKGNYSYAIMNYLKLLCEFHVLKKGANDIFYINKQIQLLNSIDAAYKLDERYASKVIFS